MPTVSTWTLTPEDMIEHYNRAKDITLNALVAEGLLTQEQAEEWSGSSAIVIHKNSWFGTLWEKIHGKDEADKFPITMMKAVRKRNNNAGTTDGTKDESGANDLARFNPN